MRRLLCCLLAALGLLLLTPGTAWAQVHQHENDDGVAMVRSLESLRDLDYDSWQAVAYREGPPGQPVVLRVVGYPGKLRLNTTRSGSGERWPLLVSSGSSPRTVPPPTTTASMPLRSRCTQSRAGGPLIH